MGNHEYARFAASLLAGRNVDFMVGDAISSLKRFEEAGRQFDFVSIDADKPMHAEYFEMALKLLRPGGVIVMFGMILFPTIEDQQAMTAIQKWIVTDKRIATVQMPVGCGM